MDFNETTAKREELGLEEQGRAIARGISKENAQKERNKARAEKRQQTMLENAAKKVFTNY